MSSFLFFLLILIRCKGLEIKIIKHRVSLCLSPKREEEKRMGFNTGEWTIITIVTTGDIQI